MITIGGKRDTLAGIIQMKYGLAKEAAEERIAKFENGHDEKRV